MRGMLSLCTDDIEALTLKYQKCLFTVIYRPPDGNIDSFFQYLENLISVVNDLNYTLVLGGDLNIDMLSNTHKQARFSDLLASFFFKNVITMLTRITATSSTLLDLFITNNSVHSIQAGALDASISDHLPVYLVLDKPFNERSHVPPATHFQQINQYTLSSFREEVNTLNWNNVLSCSFADLAYDCFINTMCSVYGKHFPYKTLNKPKRARKPWITSRVLNMIKEKNRLYQVFLVTRDVSAFNVFKVYRNKITKIQKQAKRSYYFMMFDGVTDTKHIWNKLNSIVSSKRATSDIGELLINDEICKGTVLANKFNEYFTSLVDSTHSQDSLDHLPPPRKGFTICLSNRSTRGH